MKVHERKTCSELPKIPETFMTIYLLLLLRVYVYFCSIGDVLQHVKYMMGNILQVVHVWVSTCTATINFRTTFIWPHITVVDMHGTALIILISFFLQLHCQYYSMVAATTMCLDKNGIKDEGQ